MIRRSDSAWPTRGGDDGSGGPRGNSGVESAAGPGARLAAQAGLTVLVIIGTLLGAVVLVRAVANSGVARVETIEAAPAPGSGTAGSGLPDTERVREDDVRDWVVRLADPSLEGRDTPSAGLLRAQALVAAAFRDMGLEPAADTSDIRAEYRRERGIPEDRRVPPELSGYFRPFEAAAAFFGRSPFEQPDAEACELRATDPAGGPATGAFVLGVDYVPLAASSLAEPVFRGQARGRLCFAGFGIDSDTEGYDDFAATSVEGAIALVLDGEPGGGAFGETRFGGVEVTAEASLWNKIDALAREGATGALVVRSGPMSFRSTRAFWNPPTFDRIRAGVPTLEVTPEAASRLLGRDVEALRREIVRTGEPLRAPPGGAQVVMASGTVRRPATLYNVVGVLPAAGAGADPDAQPLVIGAHIDHIGVGPRGRIGCGADDNASGIAAMLAVAHALASMESRTRPVIFCAFTGEEDDLLGSRQLAAELTARVGGLASPVAMLNFDMLGRGSAAETVVFGLETGADLRARLDRALAAQSPLRPRIERVHAVSDGSFFRRSDHFAFHEAGVPVLFFFEEWPHRSPDYHTWRDTAATVDTGKVTRTARLAALVAGTWLGAFSHAPD